LLLLGLFVGPYASTQNGRSSITVQQLIEDPNLGRVDADRWFFRPGPDALNREPFPVAHGVNLVDYLAVERLCYPGKGRLPAGLPGDTLVIEGAVAAAYGSPLNLTVVADDRPLSTFALPPGPFRIALPAPAADSPWIEFELRPDRCLNASEQQAAPLGKGRLICQLSRIVYESSAPSRQSAFVPVEVARRQTAFGHPTVCWLDVPEPSIVQCPVLYYPHVLEVAIDGRPTAYRNVGRYVAVELPQGQHTVSVRFVGVSWANKLSAVVILALLTAVAWLVFQRWRKHFRLVGRPPAATD
jgi:hypothetical protein